MKNRIFKPLTSLVLAILMVATLLPAMFIGAFAAEFTGTFEKFTGTELVEGDYIITYGTYALGNSISSSRLTNGSESISGDSIENPDGAIVWHIAPTADGTAWTIYNATVASYAAGTGAKNKAQLLTDATDTKAQWTVTVNNDGTVDFVNVANAAANVNKTLRQNGTYGFACYSTSTGGALTLYKLAEAAHEHSYSWNDNVGADGSHTLTCANTDGKCDAVTTTEACAWENGYCSVCGAAAPECAHPTTTEVAEVPATCTEVGYTAGVQCTVCNQYTSGHEEIPAEGHTEEIDAAVDATCTETGLTEGKHCSVCEEVLTAQEEVAALGHHYVNGVCDRDGCGEAEPSSKTYTFSAYTAGNQYAENEEHVLDSNVTLTTTQAHFTTELRLYSSSTHDAFAIFQSTKAIKSIVLNAGNKADTLNVYISKDGTTWELAQGVATAEEYSDYTVTFTSATKYIKLDVDGTNQVRIKYVTIEFLVCKHTNTEAIGEDKTASCTEDGSVAGLKCTDCGEILEAQQTLPATGHIDKNPVDSKCDTCGANICTEHTWIDGEVITAGNCTTDKVVAQVCKNCGEQGENKTITAPGHTAVTDAAVAPTCTESGLTEGSHCSVCEEVLIKQEEVPAGHTWDGTECTVCDATRSIYNKVEDPTALKDGDGIVIYYPAGGLLISGTASETKLTGVAGSVDGSILGCESGELLLIVRKDANGDFLFQTEDGKYLTSGATGNSLTLESTLTDYAIWYFDKTDAGLRILNRNALYNGTTTQALEFYKNLFTTYSIGETEAYYFEIYQKEGYSKPIATPDNTQYSISLKGDIGVNIYYYIPEAWLAENKGAQLNINGKLYDLKAGENAYTYNVGPAALDTEITYFIVGDEANTSTVTVNGYIEAAQTAFAGNANLLALLNALEAYGAAAKAYDPSDTTKATIDLNETSVLYEYIQRCKPDQMPETNVIEFTEISAVLNSLNTLKIHLNTTDIFTTPLTYTLEANGTLITEGSFADIASTGIVYIYNVPAYALDTVFTLTVVGGGNTSTVSASVMSYVYSAIYGGAAPSASLYNLLIALAEYSNAANTYFGA